MPVITLTTDFGTRDHYVAAMKGVILSVVPDVRIVDVTHEIEPHEVVAGAFMLHQAWPWFPAGAVHVAVVDPGVGSSRRILLGRYGGSYVVAPDNGLITFVHREHGPEVLRVVENTRFFLGGPSSTFHGRDIMAPVAAHLANGVDPNEFGPPAGRVELLDVPLRAERSGDGFCGRVLHVDWFGTLVTNVHATQLFNSERANQCWQVHVDASSLGALRSTFSDVPIGDAAALIGSGGFVEVAVNRGRAVDRFGRSPVIRVSEVGVDGKS
jgi:S-adenosyl-L-methionine hydrolase (adenosine-forming)